MKPFCRSGAEFEIMKMTTSEDQRDKMRKLPDHSRVRRRLFDADPQDQAAIDNFANILQESCKIDRDNMMKKWNFDFEKEIPLDGPYEWFRKDENSWVRMKPAQTDIEDKFEPIEKENQTTPRAMTVGAPPVVRKRKRDSFLSDKGAKRKISFD